MRTKEQLMSLAKDAVTHAQINERIWIDNGYNREFQPRITLYENGFIVDMWHTAAHPQAQEQHKVLIMGEKELGKMLSQHRFFSLAGINSEYNHNLAADVLIQLIDNSYFE